MTSDQKTDSTQLPPRIVVIGAPGVAERLRRLLADEDVVVDSRPTTEGLSDAAAEGPDLLVVPSDHIESDAAERRVLRLADDERAPDVVVLSSDDDPDERARLAAAGASVLDGRRDAEALGRDVAHLASDSAARPGPGERASSSPARLADFITHSPRMRAFLDLVHRVAASDASLLLRGETGVGKSRLARAIHAESPRADEPFVEINCGAIPADLLESELFGAEAGAFTGAERRRRGHFERAHRGTVFLDEVAELPTELQVKLLTVLQRRRIRRLGGTDDIPVDVRVIAATNRDLDQEIAAGRFRQDLFYRLNVVPLVVPPLREHLDDVPDLVGGFLRHFRETVPERAIESIDEDALQALMAHDWPGNVRELSNVIERAVLLARGSRLRLDDLPEALRGRVVTTRPAPEPRGDAPAWRGQTLGEARKQVVRDFERAYLEQALRENAGHIGDTARQAGISTRALYGKLRALELRKEDFKPRAS